ncbi:MAG: hypothetical protein M3203_04135 [Actinomycetota bacterium]|nr:hypothetical protein [Actinomycetota bacterium]
MNVLTHVVTDTNVLWYPIVALSAPAVIVGVLTRVDRIRQGVAATDVRGADAQRR